MNYNYKKIKEAGMDIEIRNNRDGYFKVYLVKNGERLLSVMARDNKKTAQEMQMIIKDTSMGTHLDNAMREIVKSEIFKNNNNSQILDAVINTTNNKRKIKI